MLSLTPCGIMNFIAHIGAVPLGYTTPFIMDIEEKEMCAGSSLCVECRDAEVLKRLQPQAGESRAGRAAVWSKGERK